MGNKKDEQTINIQGLVDVYPVERKRAKKVESAFSFKYNLSLNGLKQIVCMKAFLSTFRISKKLVSQVRDLAAKGKSPYDMHRKKSSTNALADKITFSIRQHINYFPLKISNYSGKTVKYLGAELSVNKMFSLFKEKYH